MTCRHDNVASYKDAGALQHELAQMRERDEYPYGLQAFGTIWPYGHC